MKFFCEEIAKRILPSVRAEISRELVKKYGLSQTEVAKKLGITQAAVSQYVKRIRADRTIPGSIISDACKKIISKDLDTKDVMEIIWEICLLIVKKDEKVFVPKNI